MLGTNNELKMSHKVARYSIMFQKLSSSNVPEKASPKTASRTIVDLILKRISED